MTNQEIQRIKQSLKKINKCDGSCKNCKYCNIKTASGDKNIYYAFYCSIDDDIQPLCNSMKNLQHETMEALLFEIGL